MSVQIIIIALFYLLIFGVGVWASKQEKSTDANLIHGGRQLPLVVGFFTMTATWVGGGYINGTAEAVYDSARGLLWTQAPWGYAISLVIGGLCYARIMRRYGFTTMLDPFTQRYGKGMAGILFVPALIGEIFWTAAILTALGTTFGTVLNFDLSTSIIVSAAFAIGYTMLGGLLAVAYTDVIQLIFILLGLCLAIPFALNYTGGISEVVSQYRLQFGPLAQLWPTSAMGLGIWQWLDYAFLLMLGGIPWQVYFQRVLASKDEKSAMQMSLVAALGCLLLALPAIAIGAIGATADWSAAGVAAPQDAAQILPYVLQHLTPPWVATLGLGAVAAAVMSSVDSSILSVSSMYVWNIYLPFVKPDASNAQQQRVLRIAILCLGALATVFALKVQSVYALWYLCADLVYVVLFPQLTLALFSKSANTIGAAAGLTVGLLLRLGGGEPLLGLPAWIAYPMQSEDGSSLFPFRSFAMIVSFITIWAVSRLTQKASPARELQICEDRA